MMKRISLGGWWLSVHESESSSVVRLLLVLPPVAACDRCATVFYCAWPPDNSVPRECCWKCRPVNKARKKEPLGNAFWQRVHFGIHAVALPNCHGGCIIWEQTLREFCTSGDFFPNKYAMTQTERSLKTWLKRILFLKSTVWITNRTLLLGCLNQSPKMGNLHTHTTGHQIFST